MEASADFQETGDPAGQLDTPAGGVGDAGEDFEQGALAGAVAPDDADDFTLLDFEGDVFERPDDIGCLLFMAAERGQRAQAAHVLDRLAQEGCEGTDECVLGLFTQTDAVAFG